MAKDNLTPKQEAFCKAYIETGNASEAYRRSYNSGNMKPETINRKAKEVMDNGKIAARLGELQAHHMKRHEITIDRVVHELASVAYGNMGDYYNDDGSLKPLSELTREQTAAISEVQTEEIKDDDGNVTTRVSKIKLSPKTPALIPLCKHTGAYNDSIALTGANGGPIEVDSTPGDATIEAARRIAYALSAALTQKDE